MIMGAALDAVRNWLIAEYEHLDNRYCGVQHRAFPPTVAPDFYIAIDDAGISATAGTNNQWLGEMVNVTVAIWKRQAGIPKDQSQEFLLPAEVYRPQAKTLDKIERDIMKLHQNYAVLETLRQLIGEAPEIYGDCPAMPLSFQGRGPNEDMSLPWDGNASDTHTFIGRRYKFRGFNRWFLQITKLEVVTTDIPAAPNNEAYQTSTLQATGGRYPHTWTIIAGELPPGITMDANGRIAGTPAVTGGGMFDDGMFEGMISGQYRWPFTARVTDSSTPPTTQDRALTFYVVP